MDKFNFSQSQTHNELSNLQASLHSSNLSNNSSRVSFFASSINQNNNSSNQQDTGQSQSGILISANIDGFIIQLDEKQLIRFKEQQIKEIKNVLQLDNSLIQLNFPQSHIKALANGLMNLRNEKVQRDIYQWLKENISKVYQEERNDQLKTQSNKYDYIRYFYFKNSESFKKDNPDVDYGQKIVKYKNQIIVLIGIIENFLNQPLQHFRIFELFKQQYENFKQSEIAKEINGYHVQELMNYLLYLTKLRLDQNQSPTITFEVNQKLYLYLNSKNEPFEVMMKFIKYLLVTNGISYDSEDMQIFWRVFKVSVISYFKTDLRQTGIGQQYEMQLSIVFEDISSQYYKFCNAYLLYDKMFQGSFQNIPFKCLYCQVDNLSSINYVKQQPQEGMLCYKCCQ